MQITVDQLFAMLRNEGRLFSVTFERRTDSRRNVQLAGDDRTMLCKTGMSKYKKGLVLDAARDEEDFRHGILTVWDVNAYHRNVRRGLADFMAGWKAWRRIDLCGIRELSLLDEEQLPPLIHNELHSLTNEFRLENMPQSA